MGKVVGGQEYLTVFDGLTGKAVHTVFYNPNRNAQYGGEADGSIVIIESTNSVDGTLTLTNSSGQPDGPFTYARSDDGSKYYCTMTADGQIGFCGAHPYIGAIKRIRIFSPVMSGDANGDGTVDIVDVTSTIDQILNGQ